MSSGTAAASGSGLRILKTISLVVMAVFYFAAGVNHFRAPAFYLPLMPPYLPWLSGLVALSGVAELILGVAVLVPSLRRWACWGIIAMLIAFMPVHIHMVVNSHLYPDVPVVALWLRFPLQALFVLWAWWHSK